jgi:hypothetical protein
MSDPTQDVWYYEHKGNRVGPLRKSQIIDLVNQGVIRPDTLVWPGQGDWIPANQSELAALFNPNLSEPPALPAQKVDNRFVWLVAAVPILGFLVEMVLPQEFKPTYALVAGYLIINTALLALDEHRLHAAGYQAPELGWILLIPFYLWRRAALLRQPKTLLVAWLVVFGISLVLRPLGNPFGQALVRVQCRGASSETVQCQFSNEGSASGTMCVDVVLVCYDGRHRSHICSTSIAPGEADSRVANVWSPPLAQPPYCTEIEYENMKVTVP